MAASKSSSNSSKTAHVMNLLRKNEPAPAPEKAAETPVAAAAAAITEAPAAAEGPAPRPNPQVPPILTSLNADAEISDQIRDALESALTESIAAETSAPPAPPRREEAPPPPVQARQEPAASAPAEPPVWEPAPLPEEEPPAPAAPAYQPMPIPVVIVEEPPQPGPMPEPRSAPQPSSAPAPQPVSEPQPSTPRTRSQEFSAPVQAREEVSPAQPADKPQPAVPALHNVMLRLTEERAEKYISLFGLCPCQRCRNDVLALTLNNLSPQYVVMAEAELSVRQDMYGNRYNSEITAQLLRACKEVMEHPRHDG